MINPIASLAKAHALRVARSIEKRPELTLKALGFPVTAENTQALRELCLQLIRGGGDLPAAVMQTLKGVVDARG